MRLSIGLVFLITAITLLADAVATPGIQPIKAFLGSACAGVYLALTHIKEIKGGR